MRLTEAKGWDNFTKREEISCHGNLDKDRSSGCDKIQSELQEVTINPESKVDLINWLSLQNRENGYIYPSFSFQQHVTSMSVLRKGAF